MDKMKQKLGMKGSIVRMFGMFECGRLARCAIVTALCAVGLSAFAAEPKPLLVPDFNRDGKIDAVDYARLAAGEAFTVWLNDDDDAEGTDDGAEAGDTNNDLHDVPSGEGNDKDCEDDKVNGRCDLLDFFPVLINVEVVPGWDTMTWKLISKSVNVVFTQLKDDTAGDFHTREVKALDDETPLYEAGVEQLAGDEGKEEVSLPDGFLKDGRGVILVEGAALADGGITLRGEKSGSDPVEVTLDLRVKNVEDMYGWLNLRPKAGEVKDEGEGEQWKVENSIVRLRLPTTTTPTTDSRHFILVHGYNTNHEEARGNAAEFYKKLWQSGSDAMFTAVEWRGDQSQIKFELLGVNFSPNYHVNVENAFAAAKPFAEACKQLPGEKILVAHSLGNMLVSSAIRDYGLDYTKYVMLNAAVPREAYDASAYDEDMVPETWLGGGSGTLLTNHLDRASRWYRNFAGKEYDPYEYRRKLAWRGRFANLPRTVNYYSPTDNILLNPDPNDPDPDKVFDPNDPEIYNKVRALLVAKLVNGRSIGSGGSKKTGFGFWSFSEKMKGTWLLDVVNDVLTNVLEVAQADAYKREGGWGENDDYDDDPEKPFDPANTRFTPFLDPRMKTQGMLDILPAETERLRAQHLADAIPAESFAAGANPVATLENVNEESFIGWNPDWPLYEGEEVHTNLWNHSALREVAFYHTSKFYASLAAVGKPRIIIDTDLGSSMDDLFAVDLAARMHKAGKLDLMAVMIDRPDGCDPEGKGEFLKFADRYLASLGFGELPIGKSMPLAEERIPQHVFNPYWTLIYSNNVTGVGALMQTNRTDDQLASLTNAVSLYRRLLEDAPDKSVVICSTGFLTNLKGLMESGEDEGGDGIYSTGLELVAAKVKELRIMGGCFDSKSAPDGTGGAEYNVVGDPVAAKKVFEQWPSPIVVSPWEVGLKLYYKSDDVLADFPAGTLDPVVRAAYTYWPDPGPDAMNRLWDVMTVLPLTEGETLVPLSEKGGIAVDEATGVTTFVPDPSSNRCYQVASNMNSAAVMNRYRAICRTGNPSVSVVPISLAEAGVDYNGSVLSVEFYDANLGRYSIEDLFATLTVAGGVYEPDVGSINYDELGGVLTFTITVPADKVTAGHAYEGEVKVGFRNETLGENVAYTRKREFFVQGRQEKAGSKTSWFHETDLELPTNYVPATAMPVQCLATVETTVLFTGQTFTVEYQTATNAVQGAVRIVKDGADGYKFQYYACVGKTNEDSFVRGWWDFNFSGEGAEEIRPERGKSYTIFAQADYFDDTHGGENTLVISAIETGDNRPPRTQFIGNLVNATGGKGNTPRLNSVGFAGEGTVASLDGNYYTNSVNANLVRINGTEYATVAAAVAAVGEGQAIRLLHAASWKPTAADLDKPVKFLNKNSLVVDRSALPAGYNPVWTDVDGNDGTMTLMQCPGLAIAGSTDLPGDFCLSFFGSRDLVMLSATGGVAWTKHEEQPADSKQAVTGFWDFKRHIVGGEVYYSYHDNTGTYDSFGLDGFAPGERVVLDKNFKEVKRITFEESGMVEKGHPLDGHDFLMIDFDHYILSGYLTNTVFNVPSREGQPSKVVFSYLQEVKDGKVVWDWKSIDYPELYALTVTNACPHADDFANEHTDAPDYVHFNAMQLNAGGDLVCSFRHLDAVICLDRSAEENQIRWILSGKGDQFGLPDEAKASAQHYVTVEDDDTIRVFDNGNGRDPQLTRIMQYVINTNEMTATPEVLYAPADKFSAMCGSAQMLADGTLVIGWGGATRDADCLSVVTNGVTQMRVTLADQTDPTCRAVYCPTPAPGSKGNLWVVGNDGETPSPHYVEAWTNGNELVVQGEGTITDLSAIPAGVKGGIVAITVTEATVTGVLTDAFRGIGASGTGVALTLPDGWQGELPDTAGNWYGAKVDTGSFEIPMTVKNVKFLQRYPWNGLVDISCDLTGAGTVTLNATVLTNGVTFVAKPTLEGVPTVDLDAVGGVTNGVKFIWNAAKDLPAGFKAGVQVKVTVEK